MTQGVELPEIVFIEREGIPVALEAISLISSKFAV